MSDTNAGTGKNGTGCCCGGGVTETNDDIAKILIFGVTGQIGICLANAAISSPWFMVFGFTRKDITKLKLGVTIGSGVTMRQGDMLDYQSVLEATVGIDVVFLNTFFWETMSPSIEYKQGRNVVNAAMKNGVKHLIYAGTDYVPTDDHAYMCPFLEGKARVAHYIVCSGLPYTIVRFGWFYENFISVFRPHPVTTTSFAIPLPLEGHPINMGSLHDLIKCVISIALRPTNHLCRTFDLATCYITVGEVAEIFKRHFPQYNFYDALITLDQYRRLDLPEAPELAAMFRHYTSQVQWDAKLMNELCHNTSTFAEWMTTNKEEIMSVCEEQLCYNKTGDIDAKANTCQEQAMQEAQEDATRSKLSKPFKVVGTYTKKKVNIMLSKVMGVKESQV